MADQPSGAGRGRPHLDASGPREVVYCHDCENEWYRDEGGLVCPRCDCEVTEIVTPESDPRPGADVPDSPSSYQHLFNHNPWEENVPDPDEADIEEHITHGPGGSVFIRQTIRSSTPRQGPSSRPGRNGPDPDDPSYVMRDFQSMLGNLMGPGFRAGQPGRSGPDDLYGGHSPFHATGFRLGGENGGPRVVGGRFTFTSGGLRPRPDHYPMAGGPPVEDLATMLGNIFGQLGPPPGEDREGAAAGPPGLQGLFASLLNPANARHGDAVYTQEALDQIISNLMEQHPTSNAPGPASPNAIQALPKRKLDEELLGPEGKGECSVCMDDVHIGDEVVMLPCSHWFHEACASAWLSEHNTCPICRKGIDSDTPPSASGRSSRGPSSPSPRTSPLGRRLSLGSRLNRDTITNRNAARLDSIRATGRISPPPRRHESSRRPRSGDPEEDLPPMPGAYRRRESDVSASGNHRDRERRGNTSGSDRSRDSRHSSRSTGDSGGSGAAGGGGPLSWLRDRFSSHPSGRRHE